MLETSQKKWYSGFSRVFFNLIFEVLLAFTHHKSLIVDEIMYLKYWTMTKICAYVDKVNLDAFVCLFYDGVFYFTLVSNIKRFFLKIECQEISER